LSATLTVNKFIFIRRIAEAMGSDGWLREALEGSKESVQEAQDANSKSKSNSNSFPKSNSGAGWRRPWDQRGG
jgi:hypothetical protein